MATTTCAENDLLSLSAKACILTFIAMGIRIETAAPDELAVSFFGRAITEPRAVLHGRYCTT